MRSQVSKHQQTPCMHKTTKTSLRGKRGKITLSIQAGLLQNSKAQSFHWPGPEEGMLCKGMGTTLAAGFTMVYLTLLTKKAMIPITTVTS